jgi:hypothetical protein
LSKYEEGSKFIFRIQKNLKALDRSYTHNFSEDSLVDSSLLLDRKISYYNESQSPARVMRDVINDSFNGSPAKNFSQSRTRRRRFTFPAKEDRKEGDSSLSRNLLGCTRISANLGYVMIVDDNPFNLMVAVRLVED